MIEKYLKGDFINLNLKAIDRDSVLEELVESTEKSGIITNRAEFLKAVLQRENVQSTAIGDGIALPHCKSSAVKKFFIVFARSRTGVDFNSPDGHLVKIFFLLGTPAKEVNVYLKTLARLVRMLHDGQFKQGLLELNTPEEIIELIRSHDEVHSELDG